MCMYIYMYVYNLHTCAQPDWFPPPPHQLHMKHIRLCKVLLSVVVRTAVASAQSTAPTESLPPRQATFFCPGPNRTLFRGLVFTTEPYRDGGLSMVSSWWRAATEHLLVSYEANGFLLHTDCHFKNHTMDRIFIHSNKINVDVIIVLQRNLTVCG